MPHIPEQIIDEIAARADIVEIIQSYGTVLKQAGSRWKGCCPFHEEKTPSFMVNPSSNTFHCFGCGVGGNVFKFIQMRDNLTFPDAVRQLARKYNVMIPEPKPWHGQDAQPGQDLNYSLRERLFQLHEKLANWYMNYLKNNPDLPVAEYFRSRKIDQTFAVRFMIGAAPDSWDATMNWAKQEGFTLEELKAAHLVSESQKTPGKYFDFFRGRLIFPIWNEQGRVVGFSARQINKEQGGGKYVNSVESPIFKKSRLLYGLNFARPEIPKKGAVIICEGQMDVIAMHCAGCTNAVAPQGTAFGEDQAAILHRYTDTVLLATDADSAGMKAMIRDAEILLPRGFHLKVVSFPGGKDPDELLHNSGAEAVQEVVANAVDFFEFLYDKTASEQDIRTPEGKIRIAAVLLRYIRLLESEVAQDTYLEWLSRKLNLSINALETEIRKLNTSAAAHEIRHQDRQSAMISAKGKGTAVAMPESMTNSLLRISLKELLRTILHNHAAAAKVAEKLSPDDLDEGPVAQAIMILIQALLNDQWEDAPKQITRSLTECPLDCSEVDMLLTEETDEIKDGMAEKIVMDCLRRLQKYKIEKRITEIRLQLSKLPNGEERQACLREFIDLTQALTHI